MKKNNLFWISFADIMTSMFFIMLVLFVVSFTYFRIEIINRPDTEVLISRINELEKEITALKEEINDQKGVIAVLREERDAIDAINAALSLLPREYFNFDEINKRFKLNINVRFEENSEDISVNSTQILNDIYEAGDELYKKIDEILRDNEESHLLLIVEGNAQRICDDWDRLIGCNWLNEHGINEGYRLSYRRSLALFNYWKSRGIDLNQLTDAHNERFEVIIAGSGHFGLSREDDEYLNRRFSMQITSKYTVRPESQDD